MTLLARRLRPPATSAALPPLALLALAAAVALPAGAQTACEMGLRDAQRSYEAGLFAAVPGQLQPCLAGRTPRSELVAAYSLLARAYLAADEPGKARQAVAELLRADPTFEPVPPPRFAQLVAEMRRRETEVQVQSVSKTKESLREAPATVVVLTGEEIERRGYLDLEQVLHDLPGIDISATRDIGYSNVFMRGFRSQRNDRNLLLLDGVEQNDLSTNLVYLSRQYALSDIDRVEVVYGPASTMYGANAYTGVISVITKEPEALVAGDRRLGLSVQAAAGGLDTRYGDLTLAGRNAAGSVSWSLASRVYHDRDTGLSRFPEYRFDFSGIDYHDQLRLTGGGAQLFAFEHPCGSSPYFVCVADASGKLAAIEPTPAGEQLARQIDRRFFDEHHFRITDPTNDWSVYGKLKLSNLIVGFELWRNQEGSAGIGSLFQDGNLSWAPRQTLFYVKYSRPLRSDLTINLFSRYQQSGLDRSGTQYSNAAAYANGQLSLFNLVAPCTPAPFTTPPLGCPGEPWIASARYRDLSSQLRNELNLVYEPSPRFSAVGGIELWKSSIETSWETVTTGPGGMVIDTTPSSQTEHTDLAGYVQASYRPRPTLKLVLAGRLNYNTIDNKPGASGFGALFSPRAAIVYTPAAKRLTFKAVYSEAFKDPTDAQKFGILHLFNEFPSLGLKPERVRNFELSAGWQPSEAAAVEVAAYQADYSDLVSLARVPGCMLPFGCFRWANRDRFRVRGVQAEARWRVGGTEISGNYTLTSPFQLDPKDPSGSPLLDERGKPIHQLRIGDIAAHRANLGANRDWLGRLNTDLRLRWVGPRPVGTRTTDTGNALARVGSYTEAQATVSYRGILPGTTLQLIIDNLFGSTYFDPGTTPITALAEVRRPGRTLYLRIVAGLGRPAARPEEALAGGGAP
jgi:outer membrane receptor for ferrienterochelin and colicins